MSGAMEGAAALGEGVCVPGHASPLLSPLLYREMAASALGGTPAAASSRMRAQASR